MNFKVWDKTSNINNCTAEDYLANHPEITGNDEIVLVSGDNGSVMYVENATMLRDQLKLASDTDAVSVVNTHMNNIALDNSAASAKKDETDALAQKIADIEFTFAINGMEV